MALPLFEVDGYLPAGVHEGFEEEVRLRFGAASPRRVYLWSRVMEWIKLGRSIGAPKLLIDGSFVSAKEEPEDVDAVLWRPVDFETRYFAGDAAAVTLDYMFRYREPEELFAADTQREWNAWVEFFSLVRDNASRSKGLVEIRL